MKINTSNKRRQSGNTLVTVIVIGGVMSVVLAGILSMSSNSVKQAYTRTDWNAAYYHAENALNWAAQKAIDNLPSAGCSNYYSTANNTLPLSYMATVADTSANSNSPSTSTVNYNKRASQSGFKNAWVTVQNTNASMSNLLVITASAKVGNAIRTLTTTVKVRPVSEVFDYEYFLNNWGWWWGSTITGNGGQRANWDFDFQGGPTVNGYIYAANAVQENEVNLDLYNQTAPFGGMAGNNPVYYVHAGSPRVVMPNLLSFTNYVNTALLFSNYNGIWQGGSHVVYGVQSNTNKPGLYLVGTNSQPICISNIAVIPGDLIISGKITGKGTFYVGGNLYIAGDLTYNNGPDFSTPPETSTPLVRDAWVTNSVNKDLIAFAVRGSVYAGDVTCDDWKRWCFQFPGSGLQYVGDESHLGADGIAGTPDDNTPFLHADGTTSTWYDADGDGQINANYNYNTDITMTTSRAGLILNYPTNTSGYVAYNTIATDSMGNLDGIFYCNHAAAMRLGSSTATFHGAVISRNEQIIFQSYLYFAYDSRVHSRYGNSPNQFVNLGLPTGKLLAVPAFTEVAATGSGL